MADNKLEFRTVSQCSTADWCRGYNEAVKEANAVIERLEGKKDDLERIVGLMNKRKYYRKFVDEVYRKEKGKELSEPDFDYIYELYFKLQAENERLKNRDMQVEVSKKIEAEIKAEAYKECIEMVKEEMKEWKYDFVSKPLKRMALNDVDKILNEMLHQIKQGKSLDTVIASSEEVSKNDEPRQMGEKMICKECGSNMYLDDKDYNFKGNYDNYWNCENDDCLTSCIEQVRFGQSFKEEWHSENNGEVKDYVVKHNIQRPANKQDKPLDTVIRSCEVASKNGESRSAGKSVTGKER